VGARGEVYRATDTNAEAPSWAKGAPAAGRQRSERVARFQREAEILASLNHSNVAHLCGIEKSDRTLAEVMEWLKEGCSPPIGLDSHSSRPEARERHAQSWQIRFSFDLPANAQMGRWRERGSRKK
jgi:serine/threonine protein kinase